MLSHWEALVLFGAFCTAFFPGRVCTGVTMETLAREVQEIQDAMERRERDEHQQRRHLAQLMERMQSLASTMEEYVTQLEATSGRRLVEESGRCTSSLESVLTKLDAIEDKVDALVVAGTARPISPRKELASVGSARTIDVSNNRWGFWGRDVIRNDGYIYVMEGYESRQTLHEYASEASMLNNVVHKVHTFPVNCSGTGHVVRDRYLFCGNGTAVLKFSLETDLLSESRAVSESLISRTYQNGEGMDFSADETWVWLVYGLESNRRNVQLEKLNPQTLETIDTFETNMPRGGIGQTFMIGGVLYSLASYSLTPTFIKHIFSPWPERQEILEPEDIRMETALRRCWNDPRWPAYVAMLNYDHWEEVLYAWNCGHLEKYSVELRQTSMGNGVD